MKPTATRCCCCCFTAGPGVGGTVATTARVRGPVLRRGSPTVGPRLAAATAADERLPATADFTRPRPRPADLGGRRRFSDGARRSQHVPPIPVPVRQYRQLRSRWRRRQQRVHADRNRKLGEAGAIYRKWFGGADRRVSLPGLRRHGSQDARSDCTTDDW